MNTENIIFSRISCGLVNQIEIENAKINTTKICDRCNDNTTWLVIIQRKKKFCRKLQQEQDKDIVINDDSRHHNNVSPTIGGDNSQVNLQI